MKETSDSLPPCPLENTAKCFFFFSFLWGISRNVEENTKRWELMDQRSEKLRNLNINFQIFRKINQEICHNM